MDKDELGQYYDQLAEMVSTPEERDVWAEDTRYVTDFPPFLTLIEVYGSDGFRSVALEFNLPLIPLQRIALTDDELRPLLDKLNDIAKNWGV